MTETRSNGRGARQHSGTESAAPLLGVERDPLTVGARPDPYPLLAAARREAPVFYSAERDLWVVTRYEDVLAVLKDHETFSSVGAVRSSAREFPPDVLDILAEGFPEMPVLTASDPPTHTRLRRLVARAFTPRRISELEPRVHEIAEELIDGFVQDGRVDAIARFGWPLPLYVIGELLDVPRVDVDALHRWSRDWLLLLQGEGSNDQQLERAGSVVAMQKYLRELLERRSRFPRDDLLSVLMRSADGETLSPAEAVGVAFTLLVAGHLTVTRAIGSGLALVLGKPKRKEALLRDPAAAVEEILRLESPAQGLFRTATHDVELAGASVPAGARLMVHYGSANRDDAIFADAVTFAPDRSDRDRHIAFGRGIHFCLGAPLARLELRIALPLLLERLPGLRLGPETERDSDPIFFARGFTKLLVEWEAGTPLPGPKGKGSRTS